MGLLYDLIMLIIVIMFCIIGAKRGIIRSIVFFVMLVFSLLIGYIVSGFITEPVYDAYVREKVVNSITGSVKSFDIAGFINERLFDNKLGIEISDSEIERALAQEGDLSENISSYAASKGIPLSSEAVSEKIDSVLNNDSVKTEIEKSLPSYIAPAFESALSNETDTIENVIKSLAKTDKTEASEEIADTLLKPFVLKVLRVVLFILCFIAAWIILRIIVAVTKLGKNSETGGINTVLGGVLGAVKGLIVVMLITWAVSLISPIISLINANSFFAFSDSAINNSIFLRFINDIIN